MKTVSIAIPVFNEGKNIRSLLSTLLKQSHAGFTLKKILVLSDGSTDETNNILLDMAKKHKEIAVRIETKRMGKPYRINQLFTLLHTDAVVVLDGDISIASSHVIERLVAPILTKQAVLTSGKALYFPPKTFFEKIMQVNIDMWTEVKTNVRNSEMYTCEGQIRAFSKKLTKQIHFPRVSADDVYPYLYCRKQQLPYTFVPAAQIYYGLPSTFSDYVKQHTRYLHSRAIQSRNFTNDIISENYVISLMDKLSAYSRHFFKHPLTVTLYTVLLLFPKVEVYFKHEGISDRWAIISSTKK